MSLNGPTTSITPNLCQLLLGSNYVYLNCTLDRYIPENEEGKVNLDYIIAQADAVGITAAQDMVAKYWPKD